MKRQILISLVILLTIQTLVSAADLYVPSRDYPTIQSAITAAFNGDVVIVAPDVYTGPGNVDLDFQGKAITLRSQINPDNPEPGIIASTIIDCQGNKYEPHRAFYFRNGEGTDSKVLGFTIRNGYGRGPKGADGVFGYNGDPSFGDPAALFIPIPPCDDPNECPPYALNGADASGDGYGGAILCAGASPTIQYCVISNCTVTGAQGGDGADGLSGTWFHWVIADFNTNDSPWTLNPDAELEENSDGQWGGTGGNGSGNGYGGAIACLAGSNPIISGCTMSDNFARGGCGGDGGDGGNAAEPPDYDEGLESFGGGGGMGTGDGIGGAIYAGIGSSPVITNCTFSNNIATTGTRAVGGPPGEGNPIPDEDGGPATAGASGIVVSSGGIAGGAAYYSHPSDAHFTNCTFTGNKAYEAYVFFYPILEMLGIEDIWRYTVGGALYSDTSNIVNLNTCDFTGNLGGAVYCGPGCNLNFDDCLFVDNSETADGGALYIGPGCTVVLQNCIFAGNSAYDDGGALKCKSNATFTNCSFGGNRADSDNDDYGYGGAIDAYEQGTTLIVDFNSCGFTGNQAIYGGGFSSENFNVNFTDCYFIGNTAQDGGGLDLVNGDLSVTGGAVKGNNAIDGYGGGFNCRYTKAEIRDCTIIDNFADGVYPAGGSGGAINFYGGASTQAVFNCLITGNSATVDGGAISCHNASPEIGNCTFSDNSADDGYGGAIFSDFISDPNIIDCIFENCGNHAIHEEDPCGDATVTFSLFFNNPDGDYYDSGTGMTYSGPGQVGSIPGGVANLYGNPLFVAGPLGDYYLSQIAAGQGGNSPAIDSGSDTAVNLGLDIYITRTDNAGDAGQVDRGYHYLDSAGVGVFQLTASVIGGHGTVEPTSGTYYAGTVVTLTAEPNPGWRVKAWSGTDDDTSTATTNTVIMNSNRTVTVEFEQPRTLRVAVSGGEEDYYSTIQDAISDAEDGDTIWVYPGIYYGGYLGESVYIDKPILTIRSVHPDDPCCVAATVIDGYMGYQFNEGWNNIGVSFGSLTGANTIFNGFTIQNCGGGWGDGLDGNRQQGHPNGEDGGSGFGPAIRVFPGGGPVIKNCVIRDNVVIGGDGGNGVGATGPPDNLNAGRGGWGGFAWGGAVYCGTNTSPTFINCRIIDNYAQGGNGGDGGNEVVPGGYPNYGGNWSIRGTLEYPVLDIDPFSSAINPVIDADLWEIWAWDLALDFYSVLGLGNEFSYLGDYRWYSGYGGGVFIDRGSNVTFIDCTISGNLTQGGVSGQGGEFISGRPIEPLIPYEIPSFGGGVYCAAEATVTFTDCTITENISSEPNENNSHINPYLGHGGGLCAEDTATVIFTDCTFSENEAAAGGGLHFADANPIISDCNFTSNTAFHGGGLFGDGPATILRCNIIDNNAITDVNDPNILGQGGGLHLVATEADIIDCNISSNQADASGGGVFFGGEGTPSLFNCLVTNNTAGRDGGGVSSNIFTSLTISNCTIADNTVTGAGFPNAFGGGLYVSYESDVNVIDSIIWSNFAVDGPQVAVGTGFIHDQAPSKVTVSYSDIGPRAGWVDFEAGEPFWADWDQNDGAALIDGQNIYDQFGVDGWAEIIVSLFEPIELRRTTDWTSPESVTVLREEIDERQDSVLSTLTPAEFTLRHRYENQAGFSGEVTINGLNKLLSNSLVAYIEPVRYVQPMLAQAIPLANALEARQVYDGTGVAVAIVDSGVDYTHPRLGNNGFPNTKVIGGYDTGNNDSDPMPVGEAHGTCCAGIAAGDLGTVGDYIGGVAPNAKIYALKLTTDEGLWPTDSDLAAWDWCVTHANDDPDNPIKVMSNSWGIYDFPFNDAAAADALFPAHAVAVDTANAAGIAVLASSGNDGFAGEGISWPSAMSKVISVGGVFDTTDQVTDYSNTADILDILAPADPIYTTDIVGSAGYDVGDYFPYFNGTSASCPFAAGVVAGIQSAAMAEWGRYLTPEEVRTVLVVSGVPVTDTKVNITKPRANLAAAISYLIAPPIYVEDDCTFIGWDPNAVNVGDWDPNFSGYANISENPLFVDGYLLSQTEAGQEEDSPCVDTGSDLAINLGLNTYTTRTDQIFDKGFVDMGYHYPLALPESCRICDFVPDGVIDFKDFAIFAQFWFEEDCYPDNNWCAGADLTFDTRVDIIDSLVFAICWLVEDNIPPLPNPSEWEIEPYSTSMTPPYSISMTAKPSFDLWGWNVEYYFECVTDGDFNSPGWQSSPTYEASGLTKNVKYGFRVRARDTRPFIPDDGTGEQGNKTEWSVDSNAIAGEEPVVEDHNPPIPNPMTWAIEPYATSPTSIAMVATIAIDDTAGVEYYFENFFFPAVNSGWIGVPTWTDVGLMPNTTYTYRVMARDTSPWWNETGWSDPCSATTPEEVLEDTTPPAPVEWEIEPYETGSGMDAFANMTAAEAIDPEGNGVQYYFECVDIPSINSGWMDEQEWNDVPIGRENQFLYFHFKVRDLSPNLNESGWSTSLPCY